MAIRRNPRPDLSPDLVSGAILRLTSRSSETEAGCWEVDTQQHAGYASVSIKNWPFLAHRVAYLFFRGDIPDHLTDLDHFECQNKRCWNPWHVEPVTHQENMARHNLKKYGARKLAPIWKRQPGYSTQRVREWRAANPGRG